MIKKLKPKTILIIMTVVLVVQLLSGLRSGIFNLILNSAYLGFAVITLLSLKKKDFKKFAGIYLLVVLALNCVRTLFNNNMDSDVNILFELILAATEIFCLYNIVIKNDYKYNKLFKTIILSKMLSFVSMAFSGVTTKYLIINLLPLTFIEEYFNEYEKNYNGLFDEEIYKNEELKVNNKPTTTFELIKKWILYILIFEMVMIYYIGVYVENVEISFWSLIGFVITIVITIIYSNSIKKTAEKMKKFMDENRAKNEKKALEEAYAVNSKEIYKYYKKNNYNINDEETNVVIAGTKNVSVDELIKMYNYGNELILKEKEEQETIRLKEIREKEEGKINKSKQEILLIGKDKYLSVLNDRIEGLDAMQKLANIMSDSYTSGARQATNTKKSDPYILGGMAQGIAGPAAGIMIASQVERENREREARGKEIAAASMENAKEWRMKAHEYSSPLYYLKSVRDKFDAALIVKDIEKAKSKISISDVEYEILQSKNFLVKFILKTEDVKLLDKDALIDGSIKVNVLDEDNNLVSEGYYSAKNISINNNQEIDMSYGFDGLNFPRVYCKTLDYSNVKENSKYRVEIEYINLWIVEDLEKSYARQERNKVNRLANAELERFSSLDDTITVKSRLNAILKFISNNRNESTRCYTPLEKGGLVFTDGYMMFRLKCHYLPCDVGFTTNYGKENEYLESYKEYIGRVINHNYPDMAQFLQKYDECDEIIFDLKDIKEKANLKEEYMTFKTNGDYEMTLNIQFLITLTKILNIKTDTFKGYSIDRLKPVQIFNDSGEMAIILPIKKYEKE